jgi:hypothetical protein
MRAPSSFTIVFPGTAMERDQLPTAPVSNELTFAGPPEGPHDEAA